MKRSELIRVGMFLLASAAIFLLPRFISDFRAQEFAYVGIYFIALLGLNVLTGYTGQISLGHGAFMAIGGYTTAILISDQGLKLGGHTFSSDMRDFWTIPLAGLVAGIAGFLFGFPALRLTGLYLALATFAIAVAMPGLIKYDRFETFTGGGGGINLFESEGRTRPTETTDPITFETISEPIKVLGLEIPTFNEWLYYLCWTVALVLFAVAWLLLRGRMGRSLRAIRDSELAAASSGVNLATYKTLAFGISAFYAGVAGSLLAIATTFVNPDTYPITLSIFLLVGVVVGGLGSLWPLVFGAIFIQFLPLWAQEVSKAQGAPAVVYGVILILVMLLLPGRLRRPPAASASSYNSRLPSRSLSRTRPKELHRRCVDRDSYWPCSPLRVRSQPAPPRRRAPIRVSPRRRSSSAARRRSPAPRPRTRPSREARTPTSSTSTRAAASTAARSPTSSSTTATTPPAPSRRRGSSSSRTRSSRSSTRSAPSTTPRSATT